MRGKVRGKHLMRPMLCDVAWRPVDVTDRSPAPELEVVQIRGRQVQLFEVSTPAVESMKKPVFAGRPRVSAPTRRNEMELERNRQRMDVNRQWLWRVKRAAGCAVCECRDHASLEFHHVNPEEKQFNVGVSNVTRSRASFYVEMAKCVLVCSNCHRSIHHQGLDATSIPRFDPWAWEPKPS